MKKLLGVMVLGLLLSGNAYANEEHLDDFNQWLYQTSNHQYLNIELSENVNLLIKVIQIGILIIVMNFKEQTI